MAQDPLTASIVTGFRTVTMSVERDGPFWVVRLRASRSGDEELPAPALQLAVLADPTYYGTPPRAVPKRTALKLLKKSSVIGDAARVLVNDILLAANQLEEQVKEAK